MTALDEFDGQNWKSDGSYESADGRLPKGVGSAAPNQLANQQYNIIALDTIWLPAAFEPRSINAGNTGLSTGPVSGVPGPASSTTVGVYVPVAASAGSFSRRGRSPSPIAFLARNSKRKKS